MYGVNDGGVMIDFINEYWNKNYLMVNMIGYVVWGGWMLNYWMYVDLMDLLDWILLVIELGMMVVEDMCDFDVKYWMYDIVCLM